MKNVSKNPVKYEDRYPDIKKGTLFNDWKIIKRVENYENSGQSHKQYLCVCKCGKKSKIRGSSLKNNYSKGCGCEAARLTSERCKNDSPQDSSINRLFYSYKKGAEDRNYKFKLKREEFVKLIFSKCYYCGRSPFTRMNYWLKENLQPIFDRYPDKEWVDGATIYYNGVDRINNNLGYSKSNCRTSCRNCNCAKWMLSFEDFKSLIKMIYKNLKLDESP